LDVYTRVTFDLKVVGVGPFHLQVG